MLLALRVAPCVALLALPCVPGYTLCYTKVSLHIIHYEAQFLTGKQTIEEERKQIMMCPAPLLREYTIRYVIEFAFSFRSMNRTDANYFKPV